MGTQIKMASMRMCGAACVGLRVCFAPDAADTQACKSGNAHAAAPVEPLTTGALAAEQVLAAVQHLRNVQQRTMCSELWANNVMLQDSTPALQQLIALGQRLI